MSTAYDSTQAPASGSSRGAPSGSSSTAEALLPSIRSLFTPANPNSLLVDLAPQLLHPRSRTSVLSPHASAYALGAQSNSIRSKLGWPTLKAQDSNAIYIRERIEDLLRLELPPAPFELTPAPQALGSSQRRIDFPAPDAAVPLIRGFQATAPSANTARNERRKQRAGLGEQNLGLDGPLGLKKKVDQARGMLGGPEGEAVDGGLEIGRKKGVRKLRKKKSGLKGDVFDEPLVERTLSELEDEAKAVEDDMANVSVRRAVLNGQIGEVESKIAELDAIREGLRRSLLGLREEELELEDELEGIRERITVVDERTKGRQVSTSSRRRRGPAFLPSEHDELPGNVAFMTLTGHLAPITALDFSEPYGLAVTASLDETVRLWDLTTGDEMGYLRGHRGAVKVLQVESSVCVTGGEDGQIKIWDLDAAEAAPLASPTTDGPGGRPTSLEHMLLGREQEADPFFVPSSGGAGLVNGEGDGLMREEGGAAPKEDKLEGPCVKTLDGHTKAVTSLYFDGACLVTGSSDSTLRQWDMTTGQCVLTMDILWAMQNPEPFNSASGPPPQSYNQSAAGDGYYTTSPNTTPRKSLGRRETSGFMGVPAGSPATTTYADGTWEMYNDFVGGVQFWGYALASGTGDGCVRMWDMRTGQAHRTLVGHTGPVTCVQFDEMHLVSGSLDKSIRIWDLRTGAISDTIRFEHPLTSLQFDTRKIVAAAGENGVRVFNRTTLEHQTLNINGHSSPVERLRYMDRYLATGGRDSVVKIWALK